MLKLDYTSALFCIYTFHTSFYLLQTSFSCGGFSIPPGMQFVLLSPLSRWERRMKQDVREVATSESQPLIWGWVFVSGHVWAAALAWCHGKSQPTLEALIFPEIIELPAVFYSLKCCFVPRRLWPIISELMWALDFLSILKWGRWFCCLYSLS